MKRVLILMTAVFSVFLVLHSAYGEKPGSSEQILILREGKQVKNNVVAVEAYRVGDILEAKVEVRMYSERPRITNVMLAGPGIGRVSYELKKEIPLTLDEEDPYIITKEDGIISLGSRKKKKKPKGTLTKESFKIKVPWNKIIAGKRYQLWVDVESKTQPGQRPQKFRFNIENLAQYAPAAQ